MTRNDPISLGKTAAIVLAAGSGSRLGYEQPKGCFPVTTIKKKSLFQLLCEKLKAASLFYEKPLEMAFMVSEDNESKSKQFFLDHQFFGADPKTIHFFESPQWPLLDFDGKPNGFFGPSGNGCLFKMFCKSPIFQNWKKQGIEYVSVISIDNPLANPFDASFASFHCNQSNEASLVGIKKRDVNEKVGTIVELSSGIEVREYGSLASGKEIAANAGIYLFNLSFMQRVSTKTLPIYRFKKAFNGSKEPNCYKCEQCIFDVLPFSNKTGVFFKERDECFAPLKNFEGEDSISTVQSALKKFEMKRLAEFEITCPKSAFELSSDFYYPTLEFKKKWQGRKIVDLDYIGDA